MVGRFITLESSEGAGKGTNKQFIRDCLEVSGREVVWTREPGGTPFAERMREMLLWDPNDEWRLESEEEMLLLFAGRVNHQKLLINPAVEAGKTVVSERFYDSTLAYQHFARGHAREPIDALIRLFNIRTPDLTIFLDVPVEIGLRRAMIGRSALDRIENEQLDFFERVRAGYLQLAKEDASGRWRIIDAEKTLPEVRGQLLDLFVKEGLMTPKAINWIKGKYDVAS